ncbi:MAG TPA: nuclear transport factor 2 family protein [Ilumatobacteraceae bacterium]|nr:nuclear transport factor 2 family protein [Ilumatobacteraceae bacterium]
MIAGHEEITAVQQVLYRYCRGLDRMDRDLVASCFAPDAHVDYLSIFTGTAEAFIDEVWIRHSRYLRHSHQIGNVLVEATDDHLVSEAYVTTTLWTDTLMERKVSGRYIDRWSPDPNRWVIAERIFVADQRIETPLPENPLVPLIQHARRDRDDPSYRLLAPTSRPAVARVQHRLDDRRAICELKARYLNALDRNDWEAMATCLDENVTTGLRDGSYSFAGRDAVVRFLRGTTLAHPLASSSHATTNPIIEFTGRLGDVVIQRQTASVLMGAGIYTDEYRRGPDGWVISHTGYERLFEHRTELPTDAADDA